MSSFVPTSGSAAHSGVTLPLTGTDLYNRLMSGIEPELTTEQMPFLRARYKDETREQASVRAERYAKAFAEYEKAYVSFMRNLRLGLVDARKEMVRSLELEERAQREQLLASMELSFTS